MLKPHSTTVVTQPVLALGVVLWEGPSIWVLLRELRWWEWRHFSTNTGRTKTISTTFRRLHQVGYHLIPFSLPDEACGRNVVEIVFVLPVFVLKCLQRSQKEVANSIRAIGKVHRSQVKWTKFILREVWFTKKKKSTLGFLGCFADTLV